MRDTEQEEMPKVDFEVPDEWVEEFQDSEAARHLERLAEDTSIVEDVRVAGFVGPLWDRLAHALVAYGYQVVRTWILTDTIFDKVAQKGMGYYMMAGGQYVKPRPDEVDDLVQETMIEAIERFRDDILRPGEWKPERGASLKTYFVGQVLIRYGVVYRRWRRRSRAERKNRVQYVEGLAMTKEESKAAFQPERMALLRDEVASVRKQVSTAANVVFELQALGYTTDEIAELMGITDSAVKSLAYRAREKRRRRFIEEGTADQQ